MKTSQRIHQIYTLLARIPVTHDAVDIMATVRAELRDLQKTVLAEEMVLIHNTPHEDPPGSPGEPGVEVKEETEEDHG